MVEIEKARFGQTSCPDTSTPLSSNSLTLESFWGLFLIAGIASFSALLIFTIVFVHKNKKILRDKTSIWIKIKELAREFDKKDDSSHTCREDKAQDKCPINFVDSTGAPQPSPKGNGTQSPSSSSINTEANANFQQSPSNFSNNTDGNFISFEGTPSHEFGDPISHGQTSQEIVPFIELANLNQETSTLQ